MNINKELDIIFSFIKTNCRLENFDIVNEYINNFIDNIDLTEDIMIGYLVATLDWKDKLTYRVFLYNKIKYHLLFVYKIDEVNKILHGLE